MATIKARLLALESATNDLIGDVRAMTNEQLFRIVFRDTPKDKRPASWEDVTQERLLEIINSGTCEDANPMPSEESPESLKSDTRGIAGRKTK